MAHLLSRQTLVIATLAGALSPAAFAGGTMFRCGSSYQDRPCDAGQPSKVVGSGGARATTQAVAAPASVDGDCADRGTRAKQIAWGKEAGKTADVQVAAARSEDERQLVTQVYRQRGSSLDVQNAVQAECMAQKERAAQAAALMEQAGKLLGQNKPSGASSSGLAEGVGREVVAAPPSLPPVNQQAASDKKARCQSLNSDLSSITSSQRAGGGMEHMEQLNRQRQTAAKALRDAGC
ncbi:MAG: hypothetical protein EOP38_08450 [Rubrivivax sp.]|nr:MAG: hypothetical protein EOP38_08450 [Rubrivivax sp.]